LALVESRAGMAAIFIRRNGMESEVFCSKRLNPFLLGERKTKSGNALTVP
jgi:hypothetical protein